MEVDWVRRESVDSTSTQEISRGRSCMRKKEQACSKAPGRCRASALYIHLASLRRAISRKDLMSITSPGMAAMSCHSRDFSDDIGRV